MTTLKWTVKGTGRRGACEAWERAIQEAGEPGKDHQAQEPVGAVFLTSHAGKLPTWILEKRKVIKMKTVFELSLRTFWA